MNKIEIKLIWTHYGKKNGLMSKCINHSSFQTPYHLTTIQSTLIILIMLIDPFALMHNINIQIINVLFDILENIGK